MPAQEHLTLRLVRLKPSEKWLPAGNGLSFVSVKEGGGRYVSRSATQSLVAGAILVLNGTPEGDGGLLADEVGGMVFWFFAVALEHLFPLLVGNEICLLQNVAEGFKRTKLYGSSSPLARECHRLLAEVPPEFNLDHRSRLLRVVATILSLELKTAQPNRVGLVRAEEHMLQVFDNLSSDELLGMSVGDLAARSGCSKRHLNRLFHEHFGFSVATMRMEMRLLKAASLLRNPDTKVINVAEQCGFNHLGLFNTCFKRRFGASPGQWRKTCAQAEDQAVRPALDSSICPLQPKGLCPMVECVDHNQPAEGGGPELQKAALARLRLFISMQNADEMLGHKPAAGQRRAGRIAG